MRDELVALLLVRFHAIAQRIKCSAVSEDKNHYLHG